MAQPLKPTLRERKRYVVYEPACDAKVIDAYQELFGTIGLAHAGIMPVQKRGKQSILRVAHNHTDKLKAAIVWCKASTITTTGTLQRAKDALTKQ